MSSYTTELTFSYSLDSHLTYVIWSIRLTNPDSVSVKPVWDSHGKPHGLLAVNSKMCERQLNSDITGQVLPEQNRV